MICHFLIVCRPNVLVVYETMPLPTARASASGGGRLNYEFPRVPRRVRGIVTEIENSFYLKIFLLSITGSYAGAGIQYVFPAFLVYYGRKTTVSAIGVGVRNQHSSIFKSNLWVVFVNLWALGCVVLVTWNHIASAIKS